MQAIIKLRLYQISIVGNLLWSRFFYTMTALFTEPRLARAKRQWAACQNGSNQLRHTTQLFRSVHFLFPR